MNIDADGKWFNATSNGHNIGVVWTNMTDGFGFIPARWSASADDSVERESFAAVDTYETLAQVASGSRLSASVAYEAAKQMSEYGASDERRGKLSNVLAALDRINEEAGAASDLGYADDGTPTTPVDDAPDTSDDPVDSSLFPNGSDTPDPDATLAATVDESDNVLELIYSDVSGVYIRDNSAWQMLNPDDDQPTIDDMVWKDVTPAFVPIYDGLVGTQDTITSDDLAEYLAQRDYDNPES